MKQTTILLIGPYPEGKLHHIGGATILFKNFVDFLKLKSVSFSFISIIRFYGFGHQFFNFLYVILCSLVKIPKCKIVIFNFNRRSLLYLSPILFGYAKLMNVKVAVRMFGELSKDTLEYANPVIHKVLLKIIKNADLLFFETKNEVDYFKNVNPETHWFPNCRNYQALFRTRSYQKKFVFISQVKIDKGVLLILDAFRDLGPEYSIEIYGPILEPELTFISQLACYKGILLFDDVYGVLDKHDVLLLPTFHKGEGYPGIVIEAYAMSVPVITTRWKSIPEIVEDGVTGLLIEPNSLGSLKDAIIKLNDENYQVLNKGAFELSRNLQSNTVHEKIVGIIQDTLND